MPPDLIQALVPVVYVNDVPASKAFYGLLGFGEQIGGQDDQWTYSYLLSGQLGILIAAGSAPPGDDHGPVSLYLRTQDLTTVQERLEAAGVAVDHMGYPDHAPGGELRVSDPDNHVIMIGQTTGAAPSGQLDRSRPDDRASILHRSAEALRLRGGTQQRCQIGHVDGSPCTLPADVKLADSWGDSAWSCLPHADEVVVTARGVYLATEDSEGLGRFLAHRRAATRRAAATADDPDARTAEPPDA